ncbi:hypothetical protein NO559_12065 [Dasania sp. GY-MA-18]|uniref:LETM1-like protein n=1 Tax=Dasania phycosphaerae TaxID=2950436 RepID=A0A9J6RP31_9GAMM|nr:MULTISPECIES: hypothetical protein [Dasania]MCR8923510.1 hypothetical protein [Dasania sp. GY-MA-18]MCZ0865944.1 hypothetical protein [Dasania phycosphaerae]MCZ0869668.1 hypothetical protein [Dasania phycosphaerae]
MPIEFERYSKVFDRVMVGLSKERQETKEMVRTFFEALTQKLPNGRKPEAHEIRAAIEQLKDVHKIAALLLLAITPGSVVTVPMLCAFGRRFGIEVLPSSFQSNEPALAPTPEALEEAGQQLEQGVIAEAKPEPEPEDTPPSV